MTRWVPSAAHPHGVELVDHVIGLDPNYPLWTTNMFSYAYFMAGRYEDALKMQARMEPELVQPSEMVDAVRLVGRSRPVGRHETLYQRSP